ncbi:hypothetical protein PTSG_02814 [Salpingoeca rosetta]|uniref:Uncharacterized protein n=1 Tax=Salpingoeca rosetta (strain ATCC 50818 / BSB-021) TaxID=946362 RepID=F2U3E6_SALR5|nr:uncharacterized protein PTSG_02814 [Salpingoeca rosetta]EGD82140.1 hypothetical protein PTSG_02814 [Salpingoeca rosetta]|eukprot:XP_004996323.1 hypothetical protein PTSG_02814 [Salpingoeca rosetta]
MLSASTNAGAASTLVCGNTTHARSVVPDHEVAALEPEGYIVRAVRQADNATLVVARGRAPSKLQFDPHYKHMLGRGSVYACYDALQQLGFAFLHPLRVEKPVNGALDLARVKNTTSEPRWRLRGFHIHTEHPLELTDMLTGFDITINGTVVEKWEDMVPDFERYLQWSVAHRLNRVEWLSLFAKDWAWYGFSAQRQARFRNLTSLCHAYATHAGVDAAIAEEQQHAMTLVDPAALLNTTEGDVTIHQRMRWLAACGFDYISTENGLSEFTHPNDKLMLHWINVTTEAASGVDMGAYIKCHISSGQYCKHYVDPDTGKPLNFNYLPILADERMGIMPHTVQFYSHDDPANTYGNANFTGMFDFMFRQLGKAREVVYHPETAYWVNFDVDVPLFLPLYALGRVRDLRRIKSEEHNRTTAAAAAERVHNAGDGIGGGGADADGDGVGDAHDDGDSGKRVRLDGHMNFDSGWEWSYWVQDVATADMFWDVCGDDDGCDTDVSALSVLFGRIAAAFGATAGPMVRDWLLTYAQQQHRLLVLGHWNKSAPLPTQDTAYAKRNGQAYIQGWDAMADLSSWAVPNDATQPNKLDFNAARLDMQPNYWTEVRPLLAAMNATFGEAFAAVKNIQRHIPAARAHIFQDLVDSAHMTFLRAQQVYALYDFAAT